MRKLAYIFCLVLTGCLSGQTDKPVISIFLNQSGFDTEWPKRFTVSSISNHTPFSVIELATGNKLYTGKINDNVGDFSDFKPTDARVDYIIEIGKTKSDAFKIAPFLLYRTSFKPALDFMNDARSVVGTHNSAYGGCPWRDGTYYSFEMPSLVMLYLSNPDYFDNIPPEIDIESDKRRVLNPDFKITDEPNDDDALATTRAYYTNLDLPLGKNVPDIVKLIHWGAGWYLIEPDSHDPSGDKKGNRIHDQTIEQFAFFLYGYPKYKKYISEKFYKKVLDLTLVQWKKTGLFEVKTEIGSFKGRETPGHSILPNLLMSEVAKREGLDEKPYLKAAADQAQWLIDSLNLKDPGHTKGQRMSEYKLYTGLTTLYRKFPKIAPKGLKAYLETYADIVLKRSKNKWDFRKYSDSLWSIPRFGDGLPTTHPGWNEPGNLAAFPALAFDLETIVDNPNKKERLIEVGVAQFDHLFGRNPVGTHSGNRAPKDYAGVERGWPIHYKNDVCARLELIRGALSSSASTEHFVEGVSDDFRWAEGWVNFNAAFNVGLAYTATYDTHFSLLKTNGKKVNHIAYGKPYLLSLRAPASVNTQLKSKIKISIYQGEKYLNTLILEETAPSSFVYQASIQFSTKPSTEANVVQIAKGQTVSFSYGYGVFGKRFDVELKSI